MVNNKRLNTEPDLVLPRQEIITESAIDSNMTI